MFRQKKQVFAFTTSFVSRRGAADKESSIYLYEPVVSKRVHHTQPTIVSDVWGEQYIIVVVVLIQLSS